MSEVIRPLIIAVLWGVGTFVAVYNLDAGVSYGAAVTVCILAYQAECNYLDLKEMIKTKVKK